jgi:hypothetical protein
MNRGTLKNGRNRKGGGNNAAGEDSRTKDSIKMVGISMLLCGGLVTVFLLLNKPGNGNTGTNPL